MKVLISTPYYLPNVSGITFYVQILAEELAKRGHQVTILTSQHLKKLKLKETINKVSIIRLKAPLKISKGVIMPSFFWIAVKESKNNDIIIGNLPQAEAFWISWWAKIWRKKVILIHHTDLSFWPGIKNKIIESGVFICHCLAALSTDYLVPYTDDYARHSYFLKHFLKKVKSIYPPVKFEPSKDKKQIKNKYIVGFCGRIAKQKGLETLIESCDYLDQKIGSDNYLIKLAGPTEIIGEKYYDYLKEKYYRRLKNNFIFLGGIDREKLADFYHSIDLLVLPSNDSLESFGWVQIEAMICGTPCVATNLPGMRVPILKTKMGELFEKNNSQQLAEKIVKVLKNGKQYYHKLGKNALQQFDYQKTIDHYEKLFR